MSLRLIGIQLQRLLRRVPSALESLRGRRPCVRRLVRIRPRQARPRQRELGIERDRLPVILDPLRRVVGRESIGVKPSLKIELVGAGVFPAADSRCLHLGLHLRGCRCVLLGAEQRGA